MPGMKMQVLSIAIDILLIQGNLPEELDGTRLYGEALESDDDFLQMQAQQSRKHLTDSRQFTCSMKIHRANLMQSSWML